MAGKNGEEGTENLTFESEDEDQGPKPVAIDLSDEGAAPVTVEGEEAPAAEEAKPEPERPPLKGGQMYDADGKVVYKSSAKAKINELYHKEKQARAENEQLRQQLDAVHAEKAALAARAQVVDQAAMDTHEQRYIGELKAAKAALRTAIEKQDGDAIADATEQVGSATSELQAIRAYKANLPASAERREQPAPRQNGNGQEQPAQEVTPQMAAWVEENPYVLGNRPEFDPEMAAFAANAAVPLLDQRYRRAGRSAEIGSEAYLEQLTGLVREEFPEYWDEPPPPPPQSKQQQMRRTVPMTRPNGAQVAPVSRQTIAQPGAPNSNQVVLSPRDQGLALKMAANGAYTYPQGHAQAGKRMNDQDALRYHARFVQADRKEQAAKKESL